MGNLVDKCRVWSFDTFLAGRMNWASRKRARRVQSAGFRYFFMIYDCYTGKYKSWKSGFTGS
jgi:hypothetical protein